MKTISVLIVILSLVLFSCDNETTPTGTNHSSEKSLQAKAIKTNPSPSNKVSMGSKHNKAGSINTDSEIISATQAKQKIE